MENSKLDKSKGYNHGLLGYQIKYGVDEKPWADSASLRDNRTPRLFPVRCSIEKCVWNRPYKLGTVQEDSCGREEAWNILEVEELEISGDMFDCPWYSGMMRRPSFASIQSRTSH